MTEEGFKRKLTAILSADVEGYSRLMDDDEEIRQAFSFKKERGPAFRLPFRMLKQRPRVTGTLLHTAGQTAGI